MSALNHCPSVKTEMAATTANARSCAAGRSAIHLAHRLSKYLLWIFEIVCPCIGKKHNVINRVIYFYRYAIFLVDFLIAKSFT